MSREYRSRIVDRYLKERMLSAGALLIESPKWCGKTRTSMELCSSALLMQDPDNLELNLHYAKTKPSILLEGEKPRLIDEWQVAPMLWNAVRFSIDNSDLEVDAIIELDDGSWATMEVKLNSGEEKAASNLLRLKNKINLTNGKAPSFLAILTGTGFFHKRDDGVLVIPIGCLKD